MTATIAVFLAISGAAAAVNDGAQGLRHLGVDQERQGEDVHLTGLLYPPNAAGTVFTLPEGDRPTPDYTLFGVNGDGAMTTLAVAADGRVEVHDVRNKYVALDGVTFRARQ